MGYNNLTYAICDIATDMSKVDFSQVSQSSGLTCRRSLDDTLFVIKYPTGKIPTFINTGIIVPSEILDHADALALMSTPAWSEELPPE
tara:strand:- start:1473 stop:1736 length:264 start_codon:yes stop_codon:yes gene_type:complete